MASITDIPRDLIRPDQAPNLIAWLASLPLTQDVRISLVRIWERHTQARLTPEQWAIVNVP